MIVVRVSGSRLWAVGEPDSHARYAEDDLVARAQAHDASPRRHRHGSTASDDAGPVRAAIVVQPRIARGGIDGDVRVAAGDGLVDAGRSFDETTWLVLSSRCRSSRTSTPRPKSIRALANA